MTPECAERIAYIAHTACKQTRADGTTPYIVHPRRVAHLVKEFLLHVPDLQAAFSGVLWPDIQGDALVCAYLHDVLEDTGLKRSHLIDLGITYAQLDLVERLTKEDENQKTREQIAELRRRYYRGISESIPALVVKAADRCANLEDALAMLHVPVERLECKRWMNYGIETRGTVLPMYQQFPVLQNEIEKRLVAFEAELPLARARRDYYVARQRAAHHAY